VQRISYLLDKICQLTIISGYKLRI